MTISENVDSFRKELMEACKNFGRQLDEIKIVAVTKYSDAQVIKEIAKSGLVNIGENKCQEALLKKKAVDNNALIWSFIGTIQSNKVGKIFKNFDLIQSVDREDILIKGNRIMHGVSSRRDVLLQMNITGDETRAGFSLDRVCDWAKNSLIDQYKHLTFKGLMGMAPNTSDPTAIDKSFRSLKESYDFLKGSYPDFEFLSMGMSSDYIHAIRNGSTMVRIGSRLVR